MVICQGHLQQLCITGTGFIGEDRIRIRELASSIGAEYSGDLVCGKSTHLVFQGATPPVSSTKLQRAQEWGGIKIRPLGWLERLSEEHRLRRQNRPAAQRPAGSCDLQNQKQQEHLQKYSPLRLQHVEVQQGSLVAQQPAACSGQQQQQQLQGSVLHLRQQSPPHRPVAGRAARCSKLQQDSSQASGCNAQCSEQLGSHSKQHAAPSSGVQEQWLPLRPLQPAAMEQRQHVMAEQAPVQPAGQEAAVPDSQVHACSLQEDFSLQPAVPYELAAEQMKVQQVPAWLNKHAECDAADGAEGVAGTDPIQLKQSHADAAQLPDLETPAGSCGAHDQAQPDTLLQPTHVRQDGAAASSAEGCVDRLSMASSRPPSSCTTKHDTMHGQDAAAHASAEGLGSLADAGNVAQDVYRSGAEAGIAAQHVSSSNAGSQQRAVMVHQARSAPGRPYAQQGRDFSSMRSIRDWSDDDDFVPSASRRQSVAASPTAQADEAASSSADTQQPPVRLLARQPRGSTAKEHHGLASCRSIQYAELAQVPGGVLSTKDKKMCALLAAASSDEEAAIAMPLALYRLASGAWWLEYVRMWRAAQVQQCLQQPVSSSHMMVPLGTDMEHELFKGTDRLHCPLGQVTGLAPVRHSRQVGFVSRARPGSCPMFWRAAFDGAQVLLDRTGKDFMATK